MRYLIAILLLCVFNSPSASQAVDAGILKFCAQKWPDKEIMYDICLQEQVNAARSLRTMQRSKLDWAERQFILDCRKKWTSSDGIFDGTEALFCVLNFFDVYNDPQLRRARGLRD